MRLDDRALLRLRSGERSPELVEVAEHYVVRMSGWFGTRANRSTSVIDASDLAQLGRLALWEALDRYRYRCSHCPMAMRSGDDFVEHAQRRHPEQIGVVPRPTLLRYVHQQVGRAMDHEVRRYERRLKFDGGSVDTDEGIEVGTVDPSQEWAAELVWMLREVERGRSSSTTRRLLRMVEQEQRWQQGKRRAVR